MRQQFVADLQLRTIVAQVVLVYHNFAANVQGNSPITPFFDFMTTGAAAMDERLSEGVEVGEWIGGIEKPLVEVAALIECG